MQRKKRKWGLIVILGLLGLCLGLVAISTIINLYIPQQSTNVNQLSDVDITRVLETQHYRQELGEQVFPGFEVVGKYQQ